MIQKLRTEHYQEIIEVWEASVRATHEFISEEDIVYYRNGIYKSFLPKLEVYGEYEDEKIIELPKNIFEVDGAIDEEMIDEGNMGPLVDSEGNRINASIVSVGEDIVTVDINHPLAGEDLHFIGKVIEMREATEEELKAVFSSGCGCGSGGCDSGDCGSGGCGCSSGECDSDDMYGCNCGCN